MSRVPLALLALFLAALSNAAFDLQFLNKYRASTPLATQMRHVARGPGNTAYISGSLGDDVFVAQIDQFGTVLRTATWDSEIGGQEQVAAMGVAAKGSVTLFVQPLNGFVATMVKFSPTLQHSWETSYNFQNYYNLRGATSADGVNYMVGQRLDSTDTFIIVANADGVLTASVRRALAVSIVSGVSAFSAPASGLAIYGQSTTQAAVTKLEQTTAIEWEKKYGGPSVGGCFLSGLAQPNGSIWLSGWADDSGQLGLYGWMTSSVNAVNQTPTHRNLNHLVQISANSALATAKDGANGAVVKIDGLDTFSTTISLKKNFPNREFRSLGYVPDIDAYWAGTAEPWLIVEYSNLSESYDLGGPQSIANINDSLWIGVESSPSGMSRVLMLDNYGTSFQDHALVGNPRRHISSQLSLPDGSLVMAYWHDRFNTNETTVVKYRPDGSIAFARPINGPGGGGGANLVRSSDGFVWVVFSATSGGLSVCKLNASGSPIFTRISNINTHVASAFAGPNGDIFALMSQDSRVVRFKSDGYIAYAKSLNDANPSYPQFQGVTLPNGKLALMFLDGQVGTLRLHQLDPVSGTIEYSTSISNSVDEAFLRREPSGNVAIAYRVVNSLVLRRRSGTNLATQISAASYPNIDAMPAFTITPNGKLVCAVSTLSSSGYEMRNLNTNFTFAHSSIVEPNVGAVYAIDSDATGQIYFLGREFTGGETSNIYAAKYLANGVRSAQRRLSGLPHSISLHAGSGVWITGTNAVRNQGQSPFVARYSL